MTALLEVEDLTVQVTDPVSGAPVEVVRSCSFELPRGEVVALVGESGSGKTIMLRTVLGISDAWPGVVGGTARVLPKGGEPVPLLGARQRRRALPGLRGGWAAYVFQHPREALDPFQTVGRQVGDSVRIVHPGLKGPDLAGKVEEWLTAVALPDPAAVAQLHPHELSGGMAQRVMIAASLARGARLLFADEPTTGLDTTVKARIVELFSELRRTESLAMVVISHDLGVVASLADRVVVMKAGDVLETQPVAAVTRRDPSLHEYTKRLIGAVDVWKADEAPAGEAAPEGDDA